MSYIQDKEFFEIRDDAILSEKISHAIDTLTQLHKTMKRRAKATYRMRKELSDFSFSKEWFGAIGGGLSECEKNLKEEARADLQKLLELL